MGGMAEGDLRTLPGERGPTGDSGEGAEERGPSPYWPGGRWTPAHDGGARGRSITPLSWSVIYGTRAELGDAPGTLGRRAEWVGRNSTECSVDLLLEAQVWSLQG